MIAHVHAGDARARACAAVVRVLLCSMGFTVRHL